MMWLHCWPEFILVDAKPNVQGVTEKTFNIRIDVCGN